ncbi:hypothetical protein PNA2_1217 [Pyrococcus sp. NA2]|nr:hypothetical protein PNA2_1217 [Pyrococcus sp. NA2]
MSKQSSDLPLLIFRKPDLILLLFVAFAVNFLVIYGRKIPVGGNGGDTIIHMAMVRGIYLGRNPFLDQHYNVYPNWYPFLYHSLIALLAKLTHISIWSLMIWTPLIFAVLMVLSWYRLGEELNAGILLGSLSFLILKSQLFPNPKGLIPIFLPLFYLEVLRYQRSGKSRHLVCAGVILGLMLWSHYGATLPVLVGAFVYAILKKSKSLLLIPFVALLTFSPFLANVLAHIEPGASLMVEGVWSSDLYLSNAIKRIAPPIWALPLIILTLWLPRSRDEFWRFILVMIGSGIGVNLIPSLMFLVAGIRIFPSRFAIPLHYTYLLLYFYALSSIKNRKLVLYGLSLSIILYGSISFVQYNFHNPSTPPTLPTYTYVNFEDLAGNYTKGLVEVSKWINENTLRDDYLIGYPYTLEWIAGFTGRPVVAVTYGHGNPFLNMEQRRKDIQEFFTNPRKREEIIEKYGIKYVILCPFVEEKYNVTISNFSDDFKVVFHWGEFYILKAPSN